jgi:hypothetical protein
MRQRALPGRDGLYHPLSTGIMYSVYSKACLRLVCFIYAGAFIACAGHTERADPVVTACREYCAPLVETCGTNAEACVAGCQNLFPASPSDLCVGDIGEYLACVRTFASVRCDAAGYLLDQGEDCSETTSALNCTCWGAC